MRERNVSLTETMIDHPRPFPGGRNSLEINSWAFITPLLIKCKAMSWGGRGNLCWSLNKKVGGIAPESIPRCRPHVGTISTGRSQLFRAVAKPRTQSGDIWEGSPRVVWN